MTNFIQSTRDAIFMFPPTLDDLVPPNHLVRFIVAAIEQADLSNFTKMYAGVGSKAHHPARLLAIMVYGYATGVRSSRKLEKATHEVLPFIFAAAGTRPDHSTLADFRTRFLDQFKPLFVSILMLAREMKMLELGNIALDGTKIHANASRHSALSHGHIEKLEAKLKAEVDDIVAEAAKADRDDKLAGVSLPAEIKRREDLLEKIAQAKAQIKLRAEVRFQQEKAEYDEKMANRTAKEEATGKKAGGKAPVEPVPGPRDSDQINLTDEESRIMRLPGGGFEQAYNAQAAVDMNTMLVVATHMTQAGNDKEQVEPMLAIIKAQSGELGMPAKMAADTGYFSANNVEACEAAGITPFIAVGRDKHHPDWRERFTEPKPLPENATPAQKMAHRLKSEAGRAIYKVRKQTVEPVFGIIKSVMGFRQFSMRGLDKAEGEWNLVCLAWNLKRMASFRPKLG
jgi:transposase